MNFPFDILLIDERPRPRSLAEFEAAYFNEQTLPAFRAWFDAAAASCSIPEDAICYEGPVMEHDPVFEQLDRVTNAMIYYEVNPEASDRLCTQGWRKIGGQSQLTVKVGEAGAMTMEPIVQVLELVPPTRTLYDKRGRVRGWLAVDGTTDRVARRKRVRS